MPEWVNRLIAWLLGWFAPKGPPVKRAGPTIAIVGSDGARTTLPALQPGQPALEIDVPDSLVAALERSGFHVLTHGAPLSIAIDGWTFVASGDGAGSSPDFSNVILAKAGSRTVKELVADPAGWSGDMTDDDPLALSQWLSAQLDRAAASADPAFEYFNQIVTQDTWQGILVLGMTIAEVPAPLADLGIPQVTAAHHMGLTFSPVSGPDGARPIPSCDVAPVFGLIDYPGAQPARSVPATTIRDVEVRFANSAIQFFAIDAPPGRFTYMDVNSRGLG